MNASLKLHNIPKGKVIVGMSGGVDSSVCALLLKQQGYEVEGLFMKNWEEDDTEEYCAASVDVVDARRVCERLDIPFSTVNFAAEYWDRVFEHFLKEYRQGRTPNPDVLCNKEIKFKAFLHHAARLGADFIAMGHYARCQKEQDYYSLLKGVDNNKDQSYFLCALGQVPLSKALFPVGHLHKEAVRYLACEAGFENHNKKDSTGICFIGERKFKDFLTRYLPAQPGEMQTEQGQVVGTHEGLMYYTLGQRQGLGIGGRKNAAESPWYVIAKDLARNVLTVGQGQDHPLLYSSSLKCDQLSWIKEISPGDEFNCAAKIRYRQAEQACKVKKIDDDCYQVEFETPQWAVTPGQSVVFYQGEECLGGGVIK